MTQPVDLYQQSATVSGQPGAEGVSGRHIGFGVGIAVCDVDFVACPDLHLFRPFPALADRWDRHDRTEVNGINSERLADFEFSDFWQEVIRNEGSLNALTRPADCIR